MNFINFFFHRKKISEQFTVEIEERKKLSFYWKSKGVELDRIINFIPHKLLKRSRKLKIIDVEIGQENTTEQTI